MTCGSGCDEVDEEEQNQRVRSEQGEAGDGIKD